MKPRRSITKAEKDFGQLRVGQNRIYPQDWPERWAENYKPVSLLLIMLYLIEGCSTKELTGSLVRTIPHGFSMKLLGDFIRDIQ